MTTETEKQKGFLLLISFITAIGGLLFGYNTAVISGAILFLKQDFPITTGQEEIIISIVAIGAVLGAISGGPFSDRIGRKKIILLAGLLFFIGALGLAFSQTTSQLIFWRCIVGIPIGMSSAVAPLYIAELSPRFMRGKLVTINQLAITIGILMAFLIGLLFVKSHSWRIMFGLPMIPAIFQFIIMLFFPESPRWLIQQNQPQKALDILKKYRGSTKDANLEIAHTEKMAKTKQVHWSELLLKGIRPALLAGLGMSILQQVTGINTIIYYAPSIFRFAGFSSDKAAILASSGVGIINVLMTVVALYILDKIGRKPLLFAGLGGMVLSLLVLGIGFHFPQYPEVIGTISIITLLIYVASFAYSLGPIPWLLNAEIYPLHIRGHAIGVATCTNWLFNFLITATFLHLIYFLGKSGTFYLYGLIGIIGLIFVFKKVPETKAKSLEEIEDFWKKKGKFS